MLLSIVTNIKVPTLFVAINPRETTLRKICPALKGEHPLDAQCACSHDRITFRVGMKDLCQSREGAAFASRTYVRRMQRGRERSPFSCWRGEAGARGDGFYARLGAATRSRRRFEFITLTLTPRTVWMASSTRAKFPLPRGPSI